MTTSVLIIDDEYGLADIVAEVLVERGYAVRIAINGRQGMEYMHTERPDIVVLDVMMPIMTGPEVLVAMRATKELRDVPVIIMSALLESIPKDEPRLFQAVLVKPFSPDALFTAIQGIVRRR
jgi:DNA-binding response OmpR family regulator